MTDHTKQIAIRIATPESIGAGFYLHQYKLIVTAEHIVRGYEHVVIEGAEASRQSAQVVYLDPQMDLALLKVQGRVPVFEVPMSMNIEEDQLVQAYADPFVEREMMATGYIDDPAFDFHDHPHIMHDALLTNAGNGSALFSADGALLGMNNFITWKGRSVGMALPIQTIVQSVEAYQLCGLEDVVRCGHCDLLLPTRKNTHCTHCDTFLNVDVPRDKITPKGVPRTIEKLLLSMGYTLDLARIGSNHWEVDKGSAAVNITYYEKNGLIIGDAYMCKLPDQANTELFEYLLRQNHNMENLTFSVKGDDIILSLLIYDRYLNEHIGTELLTNLLEKADYFDNILVDRFKCIWTSSRKLT